VIDRFLESLFGWAPPWFTDAGWAKFAIQLVNLWLSYQYFMLITSGALQSIPDDNLRGCAGRRRQPLAALLDHYPAAAAGFGGPLLVASFTFNFNNFKFNLPVFRWRPAHGR
jgi:ABC-type sugar transport system permease subunit